MGSLYSKPKIPAPTYYTPTPAAPAPTPEAPVNPATPGTDGDADKAASTARRRNLPQTILTSFRGVLTQGDWVPARKSLLGE